VVEDRGAKILIDPKAIMFLIGTEMDYQESNLKSGFVFNNPNQISACGCGESVEIKPAAALI
jgi:iron-sulfur cluster assembly protein